MMVKVKSKSRPYQIATNSIIAEAKPGTRVSVNCGYLKRNTETTSRILKSLFKDCVKREAD
jgi:hypothetical protein